MTKGNSAGIAPIPGVPSGNYFHGLWGSPSGEVCAVDDPGQLVCGADGTFEVKTTIASPYSVAFSEAGGRLYFMSDREFGYLSDGKVTIVAQLSESDPLWFGKLTSNPSGDVFVTLRAPTHQRYACGGIITLYYDGAAFHRF